MTTKPKAKKFRIRRSTNPAAASAEPRQQAAQAEAAPRPAAPGQPTRSYLSEVRSRSQAA
ncbi:capsule biosynthesis protein, partial [Rhodobacteraceae bacterium GS-10]|nr:capsule biosynthesis protein [Thalassovita mangrovi]